LSYYASVKNLRDEKHSYVFAFRFYNYIIECDVPFARGDVLEIISLECGDKYKKITVKVKEDFQGDRKTLKTLIFTSVRMIYSRYSSFDFVSRDVSKLDLYDKSEFLINHNLSVVCAVLVAEGKHVATLVDKYLKNKLQLKYDLKFIEV